MSSGLTIRLRGWVGAVSRWSWGLMCTVNLGEASDVIQSNSGCVLRPPPVFGLRRLDRGRFHRYPEGSQWKDFAARYAS